MARQVTRNLFDGQNLGYGNSPNAADRALGPIGPGIANIPKLFGDNSPHQYFCEGSFCGYDKIH